MIALHARRSHASIKAWKIKHPERPLGLVLTGTDLYRDIRSDVSARESLAIADRLAVLQEKGLEELDGPTRAKTQVIFQSVRRMMRREPPVRHFLVTVIGHLRSEKDPFRTAYALRHLDGEKRLRVVHLGGAIEDDAAGEARVLMHAEPRYRWLGELDHARALRWLSRSHAMVISSRMEGGAHVVSESIAIGVPVIASRIPGNVGLLGDDYPGYYPVEDDRALAQLLLKAMREPGFLATLAQKVGARRGLVDPALERKALDQFMHSLAAPDGRRGCA
jgi:putative glycosyltransferase (TIGR04348 family)